MSPPRQSLSRSGTSPFSAHLRRPAGIPRARAARGRSLGKGQKGLQPRCPPLVLLSCQFDPHLSVQIRSLSWKGPVHSGSFHWLETLDTKTDGSGGDAIPLDPTIFAHARYHPVGPIPGPWGGGRMRWCGGTCWKKLFGDWYAGEVWTMGTGACPKASSSSLGVNFPSCSLFLHLGVLVDMCPGQQIAARSVPDPGPGRACRGSKGPPSCAPTHSCSWNTEEAGGARPGPLEGVPARPLLC